jgi:hypothetical protein
MKQSSAARSGKVTCEGSAEPELLRDARKTFVEPTTGKLSLMRRFIGARPRIRREVWAILIVTVSLPSLLNAQAPTVSTLAGLAGSYGSNDGPGSAARFYLPVGSAVDSSGNVYVADTYNHTIRKVTPAGVVTTLAGLAGTYGNADGTGSAARFNYPSGVAVDSSGNVYVADTYNHTIRKVTPAGVVTTLAGLAGTYGSADDTGSAARFNYPWGVAVDDLGNVYVADTSNYTIRKITVSAPAGSCNQDSLTLCLIGGRYKVTSHWKNQYAGGAVSNLNKTRLTNATGAFWLSDNSSFEYSIRINTATDNGRAWIAISMYTDVEFWVAVTDTVNGQYKEYHSTPGNRTLIYDPIYFVYP